MQTCCRLRGWAVLISGLIWSLGCGSSTATLEPATVGLLDPSQPRDTNPFVLISATGIRPPINHVDPSASVRFTNNDSVTRRIEPALEMGFGDCPELRGLPDLLPGESLIVTLVISNDICAFHEASQAGNRAFQGLIVVH